MGNQFHNFTDTCQYSELKPDTKNSGLNLYGNTLNDLNNAEFVRSVKGSTKGAMQRWSDNGWSSETILRRRKSRSVGREIVPVPLSATERAMRDFLEHVNAIKGVTIRLYGGNSLANQTIVVEVPSIMSQEATDVILLKGTMYSKFPGARMRVDITESHDIRGYGSETVSVKR